jgi:3-phenylpropionate/trans-cinnamate dioxygenase ferredoxin subunit
MACSLGGGTLEGYTIKCPCHDWGFDIRTGEFLDAKEIRIQTYEWKLSEGKILIKV